MWCKVIWPKDTQQTNKNTHTQTIFHILCNKFAGRHAKWPFRSNAAAEFMAVYYFYSLWFFSIWKLCLCTYAVGSRVHKTYTHTYDCALHYNVLFVFICARSLCVYIYLDGDDDMRWSKTWTMGESAAIYLHSVCFNVKPPQQTNKQTNGYQKPNDFEVHARGALAEMQTLSCTIFPSSPSPFSLSAHSIRLGNPQTKNIYIYGDSNLQNHHQQSSPSIQEHHHRTYDKYIYMRIRPNGCARLQNARLRTCASERANLYATQAHDFYAHMI